MRKISFCPFLIPHCLQAFIVKALFYEGNVYNFVKGNNIPTENYNDDNLLITNTYNKNYGDSTNRSLTFRSFGTLVTREEFSDESIGSVVCGVVSGSLCVVINGVTLSISNVEAIVEGSVVLKSLVVSNVSSVSTMTEVFG